jgi:predicted dehydrogenase
VGHWHTPLYLEPLLRLPDVEVVGVSDPEIAVARRLGERIGCFAASEVGELLKRAPLDFAFVLGRHADMAGAVRTLIDHKVPLAVEKPAGLDFAEVQGLAQYAAAAGIFAAVPFVFRSSGFMTTLRREAAGERLLYADFKFVAGLPSRYHEGGCSWMFDRRQAGGGTLMNLGVHFVDLFQCLTSAGGTRLDAASFASLQGEGDVEDYVSLTLRNGGCIGRIETAYLYPAPAGVFDMHFSVRTEGHYVRSLGPGTIEVSDLAGRRQTFEGSTTNMPIYPAFVADVLERVRMDRRPVAGLGDMANVMSIVDQAYRTQP